MPIIFTAPYIAPVNWFGLLGSSGRENGYGAATDSSGNIIVAGSYFNGSDYDTVLAKFTAAGSLIWQRSLASAASSEHIQSVSLDASDNIVVCGVFFVAKYSSAGSLTWQRTLTSMATDNVLVLSSGDIVLTGNSSAVGAGSNDVIIIKLSSNGSTTLWSRSLGVSGAQIGTGIAEDSGGNIYVTGTHAAGNFIAKYNTSGVIQWQQKMGGVTPDKPNFNAITIDGSDNIYVAGGAPTGTPGALLVKYNTSGAIVFQTRYSLTSTTRFLGVTTDSSGNVYVTGETTGTGKILVAKMDSSGVLSWSRSIGETDALYNEGHGIHIHPSGDVCVVGILDNIGEGGISDIFYSRVPADGSKTGSYSLGGVTVNYSSVSLGTSTLSQSENPAGMTDQSFVLTNTAGTFTDSTGTLVTDFVSI